MTPVDITNSDPPVCPWCHEYLTDSPREDIPCDDDSHEIECSECGQPVIVTAEINFNYRCERKKDRQ